jgi:hypothetical protein
VGEVGLVPPPNDQLRPDDTREALEESERLRAKGQEAIERARQIGRDYMPIRSGASRSSS